MNLSSIALLFFDLEATGRKVKEDEITQIGLTCCLLNENNKFHPECCSFESYVYCTKPIPKEVSELTRIDNTHVQYAPSLRDTFLSLCDELNKNIPDNTCRILTIYNSKYDLRLLIHNLRRNDINPLEWLKKLKIEYLWDPLIQAKQTNFFGMAMKRNDQNKESYKMGDIYELILKKPLVDAHGALIDARGLMELCQHEIFLPDFIQALHECKNNQQKCDFLNGFITTVQQIVQEQPKTKTTKNKSNEVNTKVRSAMDCLKPKNQGQAKKPKTINFDL